ncbi:MAG: class I SAM-dependent methyltransferase [Candidatus Aminicenantales bacterium]
MNGRSKSEAGDQYSPAACPVCGQDKSRLYLRLETTRTIKSAWGVPFRSRVIMKCPACQVQFAEPGEEEAGYGALYGDEYHSLMAGTETELTKSGIVEQTRTRIRLLQRFVAGGTLLDIGCSTGIFMNAAREVGFEAYGLDSSAGACRIARDRWHFEPNRIENTVVIDSHVIRDRKYDVITLWDVIEHLERPGWVMGLVRSCLRKGGIVIIRTPNTNSPFFKTALAVHRLSRGRVRFPLFSLYHTDHRLFFNHESLSRLFSGSGLEVRRFFPDPLVWKRFRYAECRHGLPLNAAIALIYFLGRLFGSSHGLIVVAGR